MKENLAKQPVNYQITILKGKLLEVILHFSVDGRCFCIFFGKTPISTETQIRPASPVNLVGRLLGNSKEWKKVKDGQKIIIERGV